MSHASSTRKVNLSKLKYCNYIFVILSHNGDCILQSGSIHSFVYEDNFWEVIPYYCQFRRRVLDFNMHFKLYLEENIFAQKYTVFLLNVNFNTHKLKYASQMAKFPHLQAIFRPSSTYTSYPTKRRYSLARFRP